MNKGWETSLVAAPTITSKPSLLFCLECLWLMRTTQLPPAHAGSPAKPVPEVSCRITQPKPTHLWFTFQRQNHWHCFCNLTSCLGLKPSASVASWCCLQPCTSIYSFIHCPCTHLCSVVFIVRSSDSTSEHDMKPLVKEGKRFNLCMAGNCLNQLSKS